MNSLEDLLKPLITSIKFKCNCVVIVGSYIVPYINNSRDVDILIFTESLEADKEIQQQIKLFKNKLNVEYKLDIHTVLPKKIWRWYNKFRFVYSYQMMWAEILYGNLPEWAGESGYRQIDFNNLDSYYNLCNIEFNNYFSQWSNIQVFKSTLPRLKPFYYLYTAMCIIKNKSYNLTKQQIYNINLLHDEQVSCEDLILELKEFYNLKGEN